jgi:hypothetical protein
MLSIIIGELNVKQKACRLYSTCFCWTRNDKRNSANVKTLVLHLSADVKVKTLVLHLSADGTNMLFNEDVEKLSHMRLCLGAERGE